MTLPHTTAPLRALTQRQQHYLNLIRATLCAEHHWPTHEEMAHSFGVTPHAATCHLRFLEKKGYLARNARGKLMLAGQRVHVEPITLYSALAQVL